MQIEKYIYGENAMILFILHAHHSTWTLPEITKRKKKQQRSGREKMRKFFFHKFHSFVALSDICTEFNLICTHFFSIIISSNKDIDWVHCGW